jgi:Domain of unknown function (DUF1906)
MAFAALDTSQNSRNLIACMKERGITAIGRYYTKNRTNLKILTADEARRLSEAGIKIWPVYQNRHRQPVDFSAVKGKQEAEDAQIVRKSEANGQTVKPGMIFHLDLGSGKGHAGLVIEVHGDRIITIEGNTNPGGSSDGFGVFRRDSRPITTGVLLGYLDFCDI